MLVNGDICSEATLKELTVFDIVADPSHLELLQQLQNKSI